MLPSHATHCNSRMIKPKAPTTRGQQLVPVEIIERRIFLIRRQKVMLDQHLANLYGVAPRVLGQAVKRNIDRFPLDFMFQLTPEEAQAMRSQFVIASKRNIRYRPYAFTEQGVAMLSSVLKSKRAIQVNIAIMRAFVKLREIMATHKDLAQKLEQMEEKYDAQFSGVFDAIRKLMEPPPQPPRRRIGFASDSER